MLGNKYLPFKFQSSCRYSPDLNLLKLQNVAKQAQCGSIWSGMRKNIVLGAQQEDFTNYDESIKGFNDFDISQAEESGYPTKFESPSFVKPIRFQPWHERECKKNLQSATRSQFKDHKNRMSTLPYGFIVDMHSDM